MRTTEREKRERPPAARADRDGIAEALTEVRRLAEPAEVATEVASDWQVSTDARAEAEADRVGDAVQKYAGPVVEGGALTPGMQSAIASVQPGLTGLGRVRFDQSSSASDAASSIDARAVTRGTNVSVAKGELDAGLAGHEATHAVAHADGMVHPKLRGTSAAIASKGGAASTKGLARVIGAKTNWDKIVSGVAAYEALEGALLKGGSNPSVETLATAKPKMLKTLKAVQSDVKLWQKANDQKGADKSTKKKEAKAKESGEQAESDDRTKAERRQAIAMLVPRINNEIANLESNGGKAWLDSLGLSPEKATATGKSDAGQKNVVSELNYQTESGTFAGFFKEDKGFAGHQETHEIDTGISKVDPNFGARSVAMFKLDKLLSAGVTARAEFASHVDKNGKTVLGTVLESAKGTKAASAKFGMNDEHTAQLDPGAISLADPVLQKSLNKLQILDAICGQLDRHQGNYYIQTDQSGKVTGVTGIDLDMAFGKDMDAPDSRTANAAHNYRGLPAQIDEEFGRRLLQIAPGDLEACITGLLPPAEVAATVKRFMAVRAKIQELNAAGKLTQKWDYSTVIAAGSPDKMAAIKFMSSRKSYVDDAISVAGSDMKDRARGMVAEALGAGTGPRPFQANLWGTIADVPKEVSDAIVLSLNGGVQGVGGIAEMAATYAFNEKMPERADDIVLLMCNEFLRDARLQNEIIVDVQEGTWSFGKWSGPAETACKTKYLPAAIGKLPKKAGR